MKKLKKNPKNRILALLILATFLCGCKEEVEIPELIEPTTNVTLFRPVERGTVGGEHIEKGIVVPTEYSHFFTRRTTIKDICCDVGEYVNEGDILATADIKAVKEELTELQAALDLCIKEHEINAPMHDLNIQIINAENQGYQYIGDKVNEMKCYDKVKLENEDNSYNEQLFQYTVDYYNKEIAEAQKLVAEGTLKAKKSGYVTYVKDMSKTCSVGMNEAVVVVADMDDCCIELPTVTISNSKYARYELKKAVIDGKEIPIEEYQYSNQEVVHARSVNSYPCVRYKTTEPVELKVGDSVPLIFVMKNRENVLYVGFDSTNADEGGNYVYVKGEDGTPEKRYVKLGVTDSFYLEVVEGLSEGEEVLYTQTAVKPEDYEEYTVGLSEYTETINAASFKQAETLNKAYFAPSDGKITELNISAGDKVKKGDVLAVIDTGNGEAEIKDIETQIKHLKMDYDKSVKDADKEISTLHEDNLRMLTDVETLEEAGEDEAIINQMGCQRRIMELQQEILEIQKQIAAVEYEENLRQLNRQAEKLKENNDGTGKIRIVSENDGIVSRVNIVDGALVKLNGDGKPMFSVTQFGGGKAELSFNDGVRIPGLKVQAKATVNGSSEVYEGEVVSCANTGKTYIRTEENGKTSVSVVNIEDQRHEFAIIDLHDDEFFDKVDTKECKIELETMHLNGMIVLPGAVVMHEDSNLKEESYPFVWKIENGELVKRFIVTGTNYGFGNDNKVVVFSGIEPGDVLAMEKRAVIETKPQ